MPTNLSLLLHHQLVFRLTIFALIFSTQAPLSSAATPDTGFTFCMQPNLRGTCNFNSAGAAEAGMDSTVGKCTSLVMADGKSTLAASMHMYPGMVCCFSEGMGCPCRKGRAKETCYAAGNRSVATPTYIPHFIINNTLSEAGTLTGGKGPARSFTCYQGDMWPWGDKIQ
jgi:hypothetical protein